MSENNVLSPAQKSRSHRERVRAAGHVQAIFDLPQATMDAIDDLKKRQKLRNRNMALQILIERGIQATQ
jgi:hypothetical protein